jgi:hypothetical protein
VVQVEPDVAALLTVQTDSHRLVASELQLIYQIFVAGLSESTSLVGIEENKIDPQADLWNERWVDTHHGGGVGQGDVQRHLVIKLVPAFSISRAPIVP